MRKRLTRRETRYRQKIVFTVWQEYKGNATMSEIANIFKMGLSDVYKALREERERKIITK